jgi:hypothetical protein
MEFFSFSKNTQILNFMKICPVGAELFLAYWRTNMTKLIIAFRHFANSPKRPFGLNQRVRLFDHPFKYEISRKPKPKIGWLVAMAVVVVLDILQYLWHIHLMFKNFLEPAVHASLCETYLIYTAYRDFSPVVHCPSLTRYTRLLGRFLHIVYCLRYRPTYEFTGAKEHHIVCTINPYPANVTKMVKS